MSLSFSAWGLERSHFMADDPLSDPLGDLLSDQLGDLLSDPLCDLLGDPLCDLLSDPLCCLEMMSHHDKWAVNEPCSFCMSSHWGLLPYMNALIPVFHSLSLSTTLLEHCAVCWERISLVLSPSGVSSHLLGVIGQIAASGHSGS